MILVGQFDSPFVRRVAVTLNHYHMPFTRNALSVFRDMKDMQKINPLVRVPALILESGASNMRRLAAYACKPAWILRLRCYDGELSRPFIIRSIA